MPVDSAGFVLKPHGFFGANPTMDIPEPAAHCAPGQHGHGHAAPEHASHGHEGHDHEGRHA